MTSITYVTPPSAVDDPALADLVAEITDRLNAGDPVDINAFAVRCPGREEQLRSLLEALCLINGSNSAAPVTDDAPASGVLGDFRIIREVGRGGMGVVYEAEQISLGRRVALKVLPFAATMDPKHLQRFHNEARAAASLHHPNIAPVFGVGIERSVHFYAMQFIDGRPLTDLVRERRGESAPTVPTADPTGPYVPDTALVAQTTTPTARGDVAWYRRVAELGIQAAEALEYAHSVGIVHRDIKPGNLLLDGHGRLWVTDFGLAKHGDANLTMSGDLLGTLRYMSPEQAMARHGLVDHRTDVYSLGATLYELLTGRPAVPGEDKQELLRRIAFEEPVAPRKLDPKLPRDLETILVKAMQKNPADRYASAQDIADDIERWVHDEPIRARRPTPLQRARKWSRRHQPIIWSAAVCLLAIVAVAAASGGWVARDRAIRQSLTEQLAADGLNESMNWQKKRRWPEALSAAQRAEELLATNGGSADLRRRVHARVADVEMVLRLDEIRLSTSAAIKDGNYNSEYAHREYPKAFRDFGIDVESLPTAEATALVRARTVSFELATILDDWASRSKNLDIKQRLFALATACDPDPWRNSLRDALQVKDQKALSDLAASARVEDLAPQSLTLFWATYEQFKNTPEPIAALLQKAHQRYPGDFWVCHCLAHSLDLATPPQSEMALRFYTAALAIRPQSPGALLNVGKKLSDLKRFDEAIAYLQQAIQLKPDYAMAHDNLGVAIGGKGQSEEAIACHRLAIHFDPNYSGAHNNLGVCLFDNKQFVEAIASFRESLQLKPGNARVCVNLGNAYLKIRQLDNAIDAYRTAIQLEPDFAEAHHKLGVSLKRKGDFEGAMRSQQNAIRLEPDFADAHFEFGEVFHRLGKLDEAVDAYRTAIRFNPKNYSFYNNLGTLLIHKKQYKDAIPCLLDAVRLNPSSAESYANLAEAYRNIGKSDDAIDSYRRAIQIAPNRRDFFPCHICLGNLLSEKNQEDEAIVSFRNAIRLQPENATGYMNLIASLHAKGLIAEMIAAFDDFLGHIPSDAAAHNKFAWLLANCNDPKLRDPKRAIAHAQKAVELMPNEIGCWNTLGVVQYRAGDYKVALTALTKSMELSKGGGAEDWLFLAMAHQQLGNKAEARNWYDKAVAWMEKNKPKDEELDRFRAEASELLKPADESPSKGGPTPKTP